MPTCPMAYFGEGGMLWPAFALFLVTGLLGGLYPAFYLSRFQPAAVLRANQAAAEAPGSGRLRTALVVFQFAIAIGLIVCTSIIYWQTRFVQDGRSRLPPRRAYPDRRGLALRRRQRRI